MAKNDNLTDFLTDVADAIREKKGTTDLINPQDFSAEIASIKSGGGAVAVSAKAVNFRDYDGTILHSYTKDEFLALTELPPLPTREGLICQEWNWNYADAVEYVSEYGVLEVGATYITDDGKTRLYINIADEGRMDMILYLSANTKNVVIDWGDNSAKQQITSINSYTKYQHYYSSIGDYCISLEVAEGGKLNLGGSYNISGYYSAGGEGYVYGGNLIRVEFGDEVTIGTNLFYECKMLESISLPSYIETIPKNFLYACNSLKALILPKSINSIADYGVFRCYGLKCVSIPNSAIVQGTSIFCQCYTLPRIVVPNAFQSIGKTFADNSPLRSIVIPKSIISLEYGCFNGCRYVSEIKIPNSVTSIGDLAFQACYGMRYYDFSEHSAIPQLGGSNVFGSIPASCKIIVPDALYTEWITATNWSSSTIKSKIIKKSDWDALNA